MSKKCQVLSTCRSKSSRGSSIYFINGISLANERSVLDLGLHVSDDLYTAHINSIVAKANLRVCIVFFEASAQEIFILLAQPLLPAYAPSLNIIA